MSSLVHASNHRVENKEVPQKLNIQKLVRVSKLADFHMDQQLKRSSQLKIPRDQRRTTKPTRKV